MRNRSIHWPMRAALVSAVVAMSCTTTAMAQQNDQDMVVQEAEMAVKKFLGLSGGEVMPLDISDLEIGEAFTLDLPIGEEQYRIDFVPSSVRSADYQLVEDLGNQLVAVDPGPSRTLKGLVRNGADVVIRASLLDDGLHCVFRMPNGDIHWIEPVGHHVNGFPTELHILYRNDQVPPSGGTCGTPSFAGNGPGQEPDQGPVDPTSLLGGGVYCAELACDADYEYYQDYGSSSANVQNQIELIINTINGQYESQTGIRHEITQILVRTSSSDPYTSSDYGTLLCQFITEWTNNQGVSRDVAHLFTGRALDGSVIGVAADIGDICDINGSCSGPIFMDGAYCLAESDCCGSLSCATDLTAHELGHLWNGSHCSCTGNTMNSFLTCANSFAQGSINDIVSHRNSRSCLEDCDAGGGGGGDEYCAAACTNTEYEFIASVVVSGAGISNTSGAAGYSDFTSVVGDMERGGDYDITVTIGNNEWPTDTGGLWIDWNADNDFSDSGEEITASWSGVGPYTATISVPGDAVLGETRMRVRVHDGDFDPMSACGEATYGEVEDYTLAIAEEPIADCLGDLNGDGQIDGGDLGQLIGAWGACSGCAADLDGSGAVDGGDLGLMIGGWGLCP